MNIHTVANYIEDNIKIDLHYKLMCKMLYFVQAWHLGYFQGEPLFTDVPTAYIHGPGYKEISKKYHTENTWGENVPPIRYETKEKIDGEIKDLIDSVIGKYKNTHDILLKIQIENTIPFQIARRNIDPSDIFGYDDIDLSIVKEYYAGKITAKS